ncbi:MAG: glycosyltransferase [Bacteroidales bacterium]|nr:glycosyltransferase [Bacteroidales bacterium]
MLLAIGLSAFILSTYCIMLLLYFTGWNSIKDFSPVMSEPHHFISVVIPYRNEEERISLLLNDLDGQNFPADQYEIIAVNDHSDDHSYKIVERYRISSRARIVSLDLPDGMYGKKSAIRHGIEISRGELILTTDADCRVSENWVRAFADFYHSREHPKLIIGLVDLRSSSGLLSGLQNLEFLTLIAAGAGAAGIHMPIYCNGANLLFEKDTYISMKDPLKMNAVSGDDTFLLHQVKTMHPGKILVLKCRDATVLTKPLNTPKEFMNQRIRWISKWRHYNDFQIFVSALIVMASNLTILGWMTAALICLNALFLLPFLFKMTIDWLFMIPVLSYFQKKKLHFFVPVLSVLYPFYTAIFALAGLHGRFNWKGRHF